MKKLKDFLYDKNDIIIALCILIVAGLLIVWRIDSIMKYPDTLIAETSTEKTTEQSAIDEKDKAKDESKKEKDKTEDQKDENDDAKEETSPAGAYSGGALTGDITVTVTGGSVTAAVDSLVAAGLFDSFSDFENACASVGASPDAIKASTFTFAAGSTKADIAAKVTQ